MIIVIYYRNTAYTWNRLSDKEDILTEKEINRKN